MAYILRDIFFISRNYYLHQTEKKVKILWNFITSTEIWDDPLRAGRSRGTNSGGGEIFRTRLDQPWGPTQPPVQWVPGPFAAGKAAGAWRWPPTPILAKVKQTVELYLSFPFGPYLLQGYLIFEVSRQWTLILRSSGMWRRVGLQIYVPTNNMV